MSTHIPQAASAFCWYKAAMLHELHSSDAPTCYKLSAGHLPRHSPPHNLSKGANQPMRPFPKHCAACASSTQAQRLRRHVPCAHLFLVHTHTRCDASHPHTLQCLNGPSLHHHNSTASRQTSIIHCPSMTRPSYYSAACQRPGYLTRAKAAGSSSLDDTRAIQPRTLAKQGLISMVSTGVAAVIHSIEQFHHAEPA
jgi:hypothetical protein